MKLIRKRGGRSYQYREGTAVTEGWAIQDDDGKTYSSWEEYQEANKPKPAPKKKAAVKKVEVKEDKEV